MFGFILLISDLLLSERYVLKKKTFLNTLQENYNKLLFKSFRKRNVVEIFQFVFFFELCF